jgi:hypothetical protein
MSPQTGRSFCENQRQWLASASQAEVPGRCALCQRPGLLFSRAGPKAWLGFALLGGRIGLDSTGAARHLAGMLLRPEYLSQNLEQISLGSNREDSQRVINERVWWH